MRRLTKFLCIVFFVLIFLISSTYSYAEDYLKEAEERKSWTVQSNLIENWPEGPKIGAGSAILMDADTGMILYEKNVHDKMFPASTTKLMTSLLAMEKEDAQLSDMVYFSSDAVLSIPWDGSSIGMDVGNKMTLEECLYAILVASANEVSNAVGEYVSGTDIKFVELMNKRAKELGCLNTHFNNAHGYTDPDHYTTAYDLAMIAKEFFKNELLAKMSRTVTYHWYPTDTQPDDIIVSSRNYLINGTYKIDGLIGSKTGFTDESRQCLVTCCERNGLRLICVIMQEEQPFQFEDTISLFNYGYSNFEKISIADYENKYTITDDNFFSSQNDIFGNSSPIIYLDKNSTLLIPKTVDFDSLDSKITYTPENKEHIASIEYSYNGKILGYGYLSFSEQEESSFLFNETPFSDSDDGISNRDNPTVTESFDDEPTFIYVNNIVFWIVAFLSLLLVIFVVRRIMSNYYFAKKRRSIVSRHREESIKYKPNELSKNKKWRKKY